MNCHNCNTAVTGRFCTECGQKLELHRPTFGHFVGEGIESLTHADSRLWQTLWYLISKPAFLTKEFFDGRRARYLPPIRLYIVLSVAFFLSLALIPSSDPTPAGIDELELDGVCSNLKYSGPFAEVMSQRLQDACFRMQRGDGNQALGEAFLRNLPKAMWVLLPVFALVMLLFWWRPRRLYAEHVLFLIHNHGAIFAILTILSLVELIVPTAVSDWLTLIVVLYLFWYTWRGMRVFYADSRGLAIFKFFSLGLLYLFCSSLVLALTGLTAVLTV